MTSWVWKLWITVCFTRGLTFMKRWMLKSLRNYSTCRVSLKSYQKIFCSQYHWKTAVNLSQGKKYTCTNMAKLPVLIWYQIHLIPKMTLILQFPCLCILFWFLLEGYHNMTDWCNADFYNSEEVSWKNLQWWNEIFSNCWFTLY